MLKKVVLVFAQGPISASFFRHEEPIPRPGQLKIADGAGVQRGSDEAAAD
jgi:hypothetical protein